MSERLNPRSDYEDEEVREAYRALPDEEVPATLDQRVIETARAALSSQRKPLWKRWSAPIALAASLVIVVAIVLDPGARKTADVKRAPRAIPTSAHVDPAPAAAPLHEPEAMPPSFSAPVARKESALEVQSEKKAAAPESASEEIAVTAQRSAERPHDVPIAITALPPEVDIPAAPMAAPAPPPPAADAAPAQRADAEMSTERRVARSAANEREKAPAESAVATARSSSMPSDSLSKSKAQRANSDGARERDAAQEAGSLDEVIMTAAARDPKMTHWLEKIHTLQSEGKHTRAAREIKKFKRAYPDVDVEEMLEDLRESEADD